MTEPSAVARRVALAVAAAAVVLLALGDGASAFWLVAFGPLGSPTTDHPSVTRLVIPND